ncbi:MAG: iron ABC transporter permease [Spirochaetaceae bacterium]|nr:iron ABC transporter permease [Spirochaetaceae bacterium]
MGGRSKIAKAGISSLTAVFGVICLALTCCIIFPLFCVFLTPKISDFIQVASSSVWKQAALNTLVECVCSTAASVLIGYVYAYAVINGGIPFRRFFSFIPLLHLVTPPFVGGLAFILLLGRQGFITHTVLGLDVSLYGFWGLLIAQTLCFFPMAYMICAQTLQNINPVLEQAAKSLGAGHFKIFLKVILPLSAPGILSAVLFIAVSVMSDFGNPMIVAGRYKVLAVEIYTQLTGWVNSGTSAVLGILLVIPSLVLFVLQNKLTKNAMLKVATIGGNSHTASNNRPNLAVRLLLTVFCLFISFCVFAQFAAIIAGSFQKLWGINTSFTLNHIKNLARCSLELYNSLRFAFEAAVISTVVAAVAAFIVYRTEYPLKKYIDSVIQLPAAVPGTLFGLAFSLAAAKLNFHNSKVLIVIAIVVGFVPFSYRTLASAYMQIKSTLDDGARSLGASRMRLLFSVILPNAKTGLFNSFIYSFVRGVGTMSAVIFLVSFNTPLASVKILNLAEQGFWGDAAALALLLTLITFAVIAAGCAIINWSGRKINWRKCKK